jgi:hypothetical protein
MKAKRLVYLGYYLKQLDRSKLNKFIDHAASNRELTRSKLWQDAVRSALRYNISILDYFYFRFFELSDAARRTYAGTGFMYEYQLRMNPKGARDRLENKIEFLQTYRQFVNRRFATLEQLDRDTTLAHRLLTNKTGKVVLKGARGQVGAEVKVIDAQAYSPSQLKAFMQANELDLLEEYVVQHRDIRRLSDSGLNTVRIFSQLDNRNEVDYLGARLRITVDSPVDNMAAGNLAAPIDLDTGVISGPAVYSDITKPAVSVHPITQAPIVGFQVPYWRESLQMVREAAQLYPYNRSIGWDVAITDAGPELIEGNHNWCKLLWQLPVQRGLKPQLEKYL